MNVACSNLPVTTYLDVYMNQFERVASLYGFDHREQNAWQDRANDIKNRFQDASYRGQLADALQEYNRSIGASDLALTAIEQIREGALTVVTGQQAGILSGPLYTIYKAITAILLASQYEEVLATPVVPVFWIAAEDHDFLEVNHTYLPTSDWNVKRIQLEDDREQKHSVGYIKLEREQIEQLLEEIEQVTHATEFRDQCFEMVRKAWQTTDNMAEWFGAILAQCFQHTKLVMINPILPAFRQLVSQVFVHAIEANDQLREAARAGAERVSQAGFEPQVRIMPNSTLLFLQTKDGRSPLDFEGEAFRVRGTDISYSAQELMEIARTRPQDLSSNVLLRPVVQDHLLPTLAYVGGGAEVAYFGMLKPIFALYGIHMPIVMPRISATIVEKAIAKSIKKYDLQLDDWMADPRAMDTFLRSLDDIGVEQTFESFTKQIDDLYQELAQTLAGIDAQLKDLAAENNQWVKERIHSLEQKAMQFHEQKHEIAVRQIQKVLVALKPENHLQERMYTILPYMIKYGMTFVDDLLQAFPNGQHANYYVYL